MDAIQQLSGHVDLQSLETSLAAVQIPDDQIAKLDNLTEVELRQQLKETLIALLAKERDLILAGEIGQSLLNANNDLRAALTEAEAAVPVRCAAIVRHRIAQSLDAHKVSGDVEDSVTNLEQHILYLESQIKSLEDELRDTRTKHRREINNLVTDLDSERTRADQLDTKLTELSLSKRKLSHELMTLKLSKTTQPQGTNNDNTNTNTNTNDLVEEEQILHDELILLRETNQHLLQQLSIATTTNNQIQQQLLDANKQIIDYTNMQVSYKYQAQHIMELRELVDELRSHLSRVLCQDIDRVNDDINPINDNSISTTWSNFSTTSTAVNGGSVTSLISELEAAWVKEHTQQTKTIPASGSGFTGLLESLRPCTQSGTIRSSRNKSTYLDSQFSSSSSATFHSLYLDHASSSTRLTTNSTTMINTLPSSYSLSFSPSSCSNNNYVTKFTPYRRHPLRRRPFTSYSLMSFDSQLPSSQTAKSIHSFIPSISIHPYSTRSSIIVPQERGLSNYQLLLLSFKNLIYIFLHFVSVFITILACSGIRPRVEYIAITLSQLISY